MQSGALAGWLAPTPGGDAVSKNLESGVMLKAGKWKPQRHDVGLLWILIKPYYTWRSEPINIWFSLPGTFFLYLVR